MGDYVLVHVEDAPGAFAILSLDPCAGFILEEGLPLRTLRRVVGSMQETALAVGVLLVTGDTKVVDRGKGDGLYVTLRIPLLSGRIFTNRDRDPAPAVVIVNVALARRYWPGEDAVGKRLRFDEDSAG